jgi:hypothetical protein
LGAEGRASRDGNPKRSRSQGYGKPKRSAKRSGGDSKNSDARHRDSRRPDDSAKRNKKEKPSDDRKQRKNARLTICVNESVGRPLHKLNQNGGEFSKSQRVQARRKLCASTDERYNNAIPIGSQDLPPSSSSWPRNVQKR